MAFRIGAVLDRLGSEQPTVPSRPATQTGEPAVAAREALVPGRLPARRRMLQHGRREQYHYRSAARARRLRRLIFARRVDGVQLPGR